MATVLAGAFAASAASAQVVPVDKEPHNKSALYTNFIRVFEVNIPPGETAGDHSHDHDTAVVAVGDSTTRTKWQGEDWSAPRVEPSGTVNISNYQGAPGVHSFQNSGTAPYKAIAVENNRDKGFPMPEPAVSAPGTTVTQQSRAFIVYDVRLNETTKTTHHQHNRPIVIVLLDGTVEFGGIGGENPIQIKNQGQWLTLPPGQGHDLSLATTPTTRVIEIEVR